MVDLALKPQVSPQLAEDTVRRLYENRVGAEPLTVRELVGHDDCNLWIAPQTAPPFVLKFSHPELDEAALTSEIALLEHLRELDDPRIPSMLSTDDGSLLDWGTEARGHRCRVRAIEALPGRELQDISPVPLGVYAELATLLGRINRHLENFESPGAHRTLEWDLAHCREVIEERLHLLSPEVRPHVESRLTEHASYEALIAALPKSIIHNDAHGQNALAEPGDVFGTWRLTALIDYSDHVDTTSIHDVAIALAYACIDAVDPLQTAATFVAAFHTERPLCEEEIEPLFHLAKMRYCVSLVMAAQGALENPENEYVSTGEERKLQALTRLEAIPERLARAALRHACGYSASRRSERLSAWLATTPHVAKIVEHDLSSSPTIDLTPTAELVVYDEFGVDLGKLEATIDDVREEAESEIAFGRYGEARSLYSAGQFVCDEIRSGERPSARTVHLGVDLFHPAGLAIATPLAATVESAAICSDPLDYGGVVILRHHVTSPDYEDTWHFYTLYGHLSQTSVRQLTHGQTLRAGEVFTRLGTPDENGGWPPHLHFQIVSELFDDSGNYPGVATPELCGLWMELCPDPGVLFGRTDLRATLPPSISTVRYVRSAGGARFDAWGRSSVNVTLSGSGTGSASTDELQALVAPALVSVNRRGAGLELRFLTDGPAGTVARYVGARLAALGVAVDVDADCVVAQPHSQAASTQLQRSLRTVLADTVLSSEVLAELGREQALDPNDD